MKRSLFNVLCGELLVGRVILGNKPSVRLLEDGVEEAWPDVESKNEILAAALQVRSDERLHSTTACQQLYTVARPNLNWRHS